ncbi:hypothetical protein [Caulobacter segnis]|uniref:hypothetical protein n=1 Tax=Caulobacter segnis TaxID=88688 RepID=UPI0028674796|nr:hypothetical protein [Caulobacter segnis]MDR6624840.1 hypothetical protein [Caulobacter segnis]
MDATYFLRQRTSFIRRFYDQAAEPFRTIKAQIECELPPFDSPPYSESGEPAYQIEWEEADTSLEMIGRACVSILSDTLKLYFQTLAGLVIGFSLTDKGNAIAQKDGFVTAYLAALASIFEDDGADAGVRFDVIDQVVRARNRVQHGDHLASFTATHDRATLRKHPRPIFASEAEVRNLPEGDTLLSPFLTVSRGSLFAALEETEKLADWIESRMDRVRDWRMKTQEGDAMDELTFRGVITGGMHCFAKDMRVPGRSDISDAPDDWPETLAPGTLNFRYQKLPSALATRGWANISELDHRQFVALFEIPQDAIVGNTLRPGSAGGEKGRAQVWRARLETDNGSVDCWVLRRIGSGYLEVLELVSAVRIREALSLTEDRLWPATLHIQGSWR